MAVVVLDIEGVLFKTRISTLTSVKGSFFEKIFSREWRSQLDKNGHLFIDRDSSVFPVVLNFLRDGGSIPLPRDDYTLARILQEARFFHLFELCDLVERTMSYDELPLKKSPKKSPQKVVKKEVHFEKDPVRQFPSSLPPTPTPVLSEFSRRLSADSTPIPLKKSTLEKKRKEKKPESISLPRNFAHVAHVGWNGRGVIFQKHLLGQEQTVKAIFDAASEADLTPVYNVVNGNDAAYGSHSLEVILAGPHMNVKEQEVKIESRDLYTRPKKLPPKPPIKPDIFPRPASARN